MRQALGLRRALLTPSAIEIPIMTGSAVSANNEDQAAAELFASLLRAEFGDTAVRVAEMQLQAAYGQAATVWADILDRLRR
jgi:hypothetical protein